MIESDFARVEKGLLDVPDGVVQMIAPPVPESISSPPAPQPDIQTLGIGKVHIFRPFPGVELFFCQFAGQEVLFRCKKPKRAIHISHCRFGRCNWKMDGLSTHLGPGSMSIHSTARCADSLLSLPLTYYEGLSVTLDPPLLAANLPPPLQNAGVDTERLYHTFYNLVTLPASPETEGLFAPLYNAPPPLRPAYCHVKAQELLLFLMRLESDREKTLSQAPSPQAEVIREVHALLTSDLRKRYTIEELSKRYLLNTTTLKSLFKAVFGQPIGVYMKSYRAKEAARLLRETDATIGEIAAAVGYESQGKFAKAFQSQWDILPTEYRKQR